MEINLHHVLKQYLTDHNVQQNMYKLQSLVRILEQYIRDNGPDTSCARLIHTLEVLANSEAQEVPSKDSESMLPLSSDNHNSTDNSTDNSNLGSTNNCLKTSDTELPTRTMARKRMPYHFVFAIILAIVLSMIISFIVTWKLKLPISGNPRQIMDSSCTKHQQQNEYHTTIILTPKDTLWNFCINLDTCKTVVLDNPEIFANEEFINSVHVRCRKSIKVLEISIQITLMQLLELLNKLECIKTLRFVGSYGGIVVEKESTGMVLVGQKIWLEALEFENISEAFIPGIVATLEELGSEPQLNYLGYLSHIKFSCVDFDRIISRQIGRIVNRIAGNVVDFGEYFRVTLTCISSRAGDICSELKLNEDLVHLKELTNVCS